jgi:hypothetical protein
MAKQGKAEKGKYLMVNCETHHQHHMLGIVSALFIPGVKCQLFSQQETAFYPLVFIDDAAQLNRRNCLLFYPMP